MVGGKFWPEETIAFEEGKVQSGELGVENCGAAEQRGDDCGKVAVIVI